MSPNGLELLRIGCVGLLFAAILSGRFSFVRFADELARADWLQLRIWFTALALVGSAVLQRYTGGPRRELGRELIAWLSLFFLLYAYLLANVLLLGDAASASQHVADIAITALQAWLILRIVRSEADLAWFARIAEAAGVVLFLFCIAGFGNPDVNGVGWAPFGGPITFYRIEFLAFCCALYLFVRKGEPLPWWHVLAAAIGFFSALASLSKTALVGGVVAAAFVLFWLASIRLWRQAAIIGLVVALTFAAFVHLRGQIMVARVSEAVETPVAILGLDIPAGERDWAAKVLQRIQAGEDLKLADLPAWQQRFIRSLVAGEALDKVPFPVILENINRLVIYQDSTARARMWLEAWENYRSSPWFGIGIGNYEVVDINRYTRDIQLYRYPHHIVLEIAATAGATGIALFAVLMLFSLLLLTRRAMADPALVCAMAYLLFVLVTALGSGDYFDFRLFWLIALLVLAASSGKIESNAPGA